MVKKLPDERIRYPHTVAFSPEQHSVLQMLIAGRGRSFSELVENAFAAYIPVAHAIPAQYEGAWPRAPRLRRPNRSGKSSRVYGVQFTAPQEEIINYVIRRDHISFAQLIDAAFSDYIPQTFDGFDWPSTSRLAQPA